MTTEQQKSAEPRAPAGDEAASETPDLDTLLTEYDDGKEKAPPKAKPRDTLTALEPIIAFARGEKDKKDQESLDKDLSHAYGVLKEAEGLGEINDSLLHGFMESYAKDNPSFRKAFESRHKNPDNWEANLVKARGWLEKEIESSFGKVSDVEAAKAAVKGTSETETAPEKGPDVMGMVHMSDSDFRRFKEKERAKALTGA